MKQGEPVKVRDVAGLTVDEQRKVAFLLLSHIEEMDSTLLVQLQAIISGELVSRGLGEPDLQTDPSSNSEDRPDPGWSSPYGR